MEPRVDCPCRLIRHTRIDGVVDFGLIVGVDAGDLGVARRRRNI